jgi:hypothetical protein
MDNNSNASPSFVARRVEDGWETPNNGNIYSIGDDGLVAIISALTANKDNIVQEINLSNNNLKGPAVASIMQLFKDQPESTFLNEIILDNNMLNLESCKAISSGLLFAVSLKKLSLKNNKLTNESSNVLFDGIIEVATNGPAKISGLEELYLDFNNIGDDGLNSLISLNSNNGSGAFNGEIIVLNLKTLGLRGNQLTDDGINSLSKCHIGTEAILSNLEKLDCGENDGLTHQSIVYFANTLPLSTSLKHLDMSNIKLNLNAMQQISEGLV